jgi:DNA-binding PadR family transcriptional regulator
MERLHHDDEGSCGRGGRGHGGRGYAQHGFRGPFGPHGHGKFPGGFGGLGGRARRGDIRDAVLRLLSEQPMHGYQIIQELSTRSGGAWTPSAGSVYPTLQLLADEGLVTAEESTGKKVFSLTDTGRAEAATKAETPAPWDEAASVDESSGLRGQMPKIGAAIWQIAMSGDPDKISRANEILTDTRKKLYAILAED